MENTLATYALIASTISSIAALLTSIFVFLQVLLSNKHNRISVMMNFQDRFSTEEMADAIQSLYAFKERYGENFAEKFATMYREQDEKTIAINLARRKLGNYYFSLSQALKVGAMDREMIRSVTTKASTEAFFQICAPMADAYYGEDGWGTRIKEIEFLKG